MRRSALSFIGLTSLIGLLISGCEFGSESETGAYTNFPVAPLAVEYYDDTGATSGRVIFDYSKPMHIQSRYLTLGDDGVWDTTDDTSSHFLECLYESADDTPPRQRWLPLVATRRSPSGANALSLVNMADGENMFCPALSGHHLIREARCLEDNCHGASTIYGSGFELSISRERHNNTITETQTMQHYDSGSREDWLQQTQESRITLDEQSRPIEVNIEMTVTNTMDDLTIDVCHAGSNAALELLLYRSCKTAKESIRYSYTDSAIARQTDYYNGWTFTHMENSLRTVDTENNVLIITSDTNLHTSVPDPTENKYYFNARGQITSSTTRKAGADGTLHTPDDDTASGPQYFYRADGQPQRVEYGYGSVDEYRYDDFGRLVKTLYFSPGKDTPTRKTEYTYNDAHKTKKTFYQAVSEDDPTLVKTSTIYFLSAPAGFPINFSPDTPQRSELPTMKSIMSRFDNPS